MKKKFQLENFVSLIDSYRKVETVRRLFQAFNQENESKKTPS